MPALVRIHSFLSMKSAGYITGMCNLQLTTVRYVSVFKGVLKLLRLSILKKFVFSNFWLGG